MADKVQVIKWESVSKGGTQEDMVPTEIDPNEDALDARGMYVQNDSSDDKVVYTTRDSDNNLVMKDDFVSLARVLAELLGFTKVPDTVERIILTDYDHTVGRMTIEDGGELTLQDNSSLILV
jgi:hypothetical protein